MVVGPTDSDSFADNIRHALTAMGHEVLAVGPAPRTVGPQRLDPVTTLAGDRFSWFKAAQQRHLLTAGRHFRPDLVITVDRRLSERTVGALHNLGTPVYLWFPDAVSNLGRHDLFIAGFDRIYLKNPLLVARLQEVQGLPVRYLPEACTPDWHRCSAPYGTSDRIAVVGNIHPTRAILLRRLTEAKVPIDIYGSPIASWVGHDELRALHARGSVRRERKAAVFRGARAVLNNLHPAEFGGTNCRLFEATAAGGLVLTEERDGLSELFDVGREVLTFRSFDELVELYRAATEDPTWARSIADAGARRSLREHTYEARLATMLAT